MLYVRTVRYEYTESMSAAAEEMPITEARDNLADLVNRVHYTHEVTWLTRRGRRLAALAPADLMEAADARALEEATARVCRTLWGLVKDTSDDDERERTRRVIDQLMTDAEDRADAAAVDAARAEMDSGVESESFDELRAELGL